MRFFTSDWHLFDPRFARLFRPFQSLEELHKTVIQNYKARIGQNDEVIIVGDMFRRPPEGEWQKILKNLPGEKILVCGNHERTLDPKELAKYFSQIILEGDGLEIDVLGLECFAIHYPSRSRQERFNLVGHIHSAWRVQKNMLNVGVDANHFYPVSEADVLRTYHALEKYDADVWSSGHHANDVIRGKHGSYTSHIPKPERQ